MYVIHEYDNMSIMSCDIIHVTEFGKITRGPKTLSEGNVLILSLELEQIDIFKQ